MSQKSTFRINVVTDSVVSSKTPKITDKLCHTLQSNHHKVKFLNIPASVKSTFGPQ